MNHLIELDIIKRNGTRNDPKQTYEKMKVNTKYVKALYLLDMNRKDKIEKNVITNESTLETTPPKDVKTGVICEKCEEIKCLFCDEIFNDRELFDKHSCNSAS